MILSNEIQYFATDFIKRVVYSKLRSQYRHRCIYVENSTNTNMSKRKRSIQIYNYITDAETHIHGEEFPLVC